MSNETKNSQLTPHHDTQKERPLYIKLGWMALFWIGGIVGLTSFVYLMKMIMGFVGLSTPN